MSGGSLAPDEGVLERRKSNLERRDWRSERTLRVSPQEEQPQGRPRVRSLGKDSFLSRNDRRKMRKGKSCLCSGRDVLETGERFCVLGKEEKRRWREKRSKCIHSLVLCRSDPAVLSLDRTRPPTRNFRMEIRQ